MWCLNCDCSTKIPFARGRNVISAPTSRWSSKGVKCPPSATGTTSMNSSISYSSGEETIEYGRSMPSTPIVQYWPGLNENGCAGLIQNLIKSSVSSSRLTSSHVVKRPRIVRLVSSAIMFSVHVWKFQQPEYPKSSVSEKADTTCCAVFLYLARSIVFTRGDASRCDVRLQINSNRDKSTHICLNRDGGI